MSETRRRQHAPESHLIEQELRGAPVRSWAGSVRVSGETGDVTVPGRWHLELPADTRPLRGRRRDALPLPDTGDGAAWREHLLRLVTLQLPGIQLRVRPATAVQGQALEIAAPTVPPSVLCIDRAGVKALLGERTAIALSIDCR